MGTSQERILIVEDDPEISDLISRQALQPLGYLVNVVHDAPMAIQEAISFSPDIIITNLNLSGLSGKDLIVALSSQGFKIPVIVIAEDGMDVDVIQAFRLGASDYIGWPIRETEVVSAVERAFTQVRASRERELLSRKVIETTHQLQSRVRELTTILEIGKAVTSLTDRSALFDRIVEGAVFVSEADKGWLSLRSGDSRNFILSAQSNLPETLADMIDQPWDDGISSLVSLSGESLAIHGAPLKRFKISQLGNSVLVVPVKIIKDIVGLMVVVRDSHKPFSPSNKALLGALADYASISLVNANLFQVVEERASSYQRLAESSRESENVRTEILKNIKDELEIPLGKISQWLIDLAGDHQQPLTDQQMTSILTIQGQLKKAITVLGGLTLLENANSPPNLVTVNLAEFTRQAISRFTDSARKNSVALIHEIQSEPVSVLVDIHQIGYVFDILLTNAIRVSSNSEVIVNIQHDPARVPHVFIKDVGPGISKQDQTNIFHPFSVSEKSRSDDQDHLGFGLALAKEIIKNHGGILWVESQLGHGSTFHFTLKSANREN